MSQSFAMPNHALAFRSSPQSPQTQTAIQDQVLLALAIADEPTLRSVLTDCCPAIAPAHRIGSVRSTVGVPVASQQIIDGVLHYEVINCVLADQVQCPVTDHTSAASSASAAPPADYSLLTRCHSPTQTLGRNVLLTQARSLLAESGFSPEQIHAILNLPQEAWYKSWWYTLDEVGALSVPFYRLIRTRHYADGRYTIQYRDYFAQEPPPCFKSESQRVLIKVHDASQSFSQVLASVNTARQHLNVDQAILISSSISELEAQGFISQGVLLYAARDLMLPVRADCLLCVNHDCPMHGRKESPVRTCDRFCLEDCSSTS
jgi:hypothetical protein